jgi:hypothetical protein
MAKPGQAQIGESVIYVDTVGQEHQALVTNQFGGGNLEETWSINLAYVNPDEGMNDQYGRQLLRQSSVPPERYQSAHGNYWKWPE